jgi:hypothetical protein
MSPDLRPLARPDVETHVLPDGSCLIFDPTTLEGHALDLVGALVWDYCDGTATRDDIARAIADLVPRDSDLYDRVMEILEELARQRLLLFPENADAAAAD